MKNILTGMRVIEASAFVAAPLGGMTLAQLGADVIRIDAINGGLDYHRWPVTKHNVSLFWNGLNKSKRSIAINFRTPEGAELAKQLISAEGDNAGMLLTNFPARGWLDYEELKQHRPDLIQLTIQGDRHGNSAVDYTVNPSMGLPFLTGSEQSQDPTNHVLPAWDCITGQMAALGLLAAERHRRINKEGQHIKLALADAAMATMSHLGFIAEAQLGEQRPRYGNYLFGAFGRDFVTSDHHRIMVIGLTPKQWQSLCLATDSQQQMLDLATQLNLDFSQEGDRFIAREQIAECLEAYISAQTFNTIQSRFNQHGVCWSRYQSINELVANDPECSTNNPMFNNIEQANVGSYLAAGAPWDFSLFDRLPAQPAPTLGQHTDEILSEILRIDSSQIGKLHDKGIIAAS
ncbi:CoA transferase [Dasania sp. GY-MA-18]|uniref:CoA transferase n=1 Tax=Dasania phycosphaerae TaxID=2950436 RepID=A0A9J6RNN5_9GAMM|nr:MULTISPECIES: CoA transferase [Dasania]MCR8923520.1 CoA transferase [Dasania sp. GY-MA-18]MCZ0865954.1 CoA transferase [Dasania phycosphaerae]MCZ0869678.1 CoA transferase [Dasania phycosphaerae]